MSHYHPSRPSRPSRPPPHLEGRTPHVIVVPSENQPSTLATERERLINMWKLDGCDVFVAMDRGKVTRFDVYGSGPGFRKVIGEINEWVIKAKEKSMGSRAWPKMPAYDANKWWSEQVSEKEAARKQMFKGPVPEDQDDLVSVSVPWPEDLLNDRILPREALGNKLEGLDPVRLGNEVFITLEPNHQVKIQGFKDEHVDAAEQDYQTIILKIRNRHFLGSEPVHIMLDDPEGISVLLEEAPAWWPDRSHKIAPRLVHSPMMNEPGDFRTEPLHPIYVAPVQQALRAAFASIQLENGYYDLSIRFGGFVLHNTKQMPDSEIGKTYTKENFMRGITNNIDSEVKPWLMNDTDGRSLLGRMMEAGTFLEPTKSAGYFIAPESLDKIRPTFRGSWVFRDPNPPQGNRPRTDFEKSDTANKGSEICLMVVQIEWAVDEDGLYEKTQTRYFQLKPGSMHRQKHLDIKLLELGVSRAWQFSLESMIPLTKDRVSAALRGFADTVHINPKYQLDSAEEFAKWKKLSSVSLCNYRTEKIYSFGIQKMGYRIELASMWGMQKQAPCWGITVRHSEWESNLVQLERIQTSGRADWGGDAIATFFPDDGFSVHADDINLEDSSVRALQDLGLHSKEKLRDGIRLLFDKLMQLSLIINGQPHDTSGYSFEGGIQLS